jgi:glycosyltransferase involved in cell wall biosynthesis
VRILHLTDRLTDRGGAHWHLLGVLEALVERGHACLLAAGVDRGGVRPPCPWRIVPGLEARGPEAVSLDAFWSDWVPDLVHVHTVMNPRALEWAAGRPSLVTVQDHRHFCPGRGKWTADGQVCSQPMRPDLCGTCFDREDYANDVYTLTATRLAALAGMRVVTLSRYVADELAAVGVPASRIHVVPPFVHGLDADADARGRTCVLFAGRLTASKGPFDALEAWRMAELGLPLLFAGTGPARVDLERAGAVVLGWQGRAQMAGLYRSAAAVILPSRWQEPFGIVGLEALALGVPVCAWASGGVAEWHPGGGLLVPWGDTQGLATALRLAVKQRAALPPGFDRETATQRLLAVYAAVTGAEGLAFG